MSTYVKKNRARLTVSARAHRKLNPEAYCASARDYRARNRDRINDNRSKTRLIGGLLTPAQYDALFTAQEGVCAICKTVKAMKPSPNHRRRRVLWVDHDHETKRVRGLLCHHCNVGLGNFMDRIDLLQEALRYLQRL